MVVDDVICKFQVVWSQRRGKKKMIHWQFEARGHLPHHHLPHSTATLLIVVVVALIVGLHKRLDKGLGILVLGGVGQRSPATTVRRRFLIWRSINIIVRWGGSKS